METLLQTKIGHILSSEAAFLRFYSIIDSKGKWALFKFKIVKVMKI